MKYHLVLIAVMLAFPAWPVTAQYTPTQPSVSARQSLVSALNSAVSTSQTFLSFSNGGNGIELMDIIGGGCDAVNPLDIEFEYPSGVSFFILKRKMQSGGTLSGELSHELVDDLNNWLNTVWTMDLNAISYLDWECENVDQRFYTRTSTDLGAIALLQILSGEKAMLDKYYMINGTSYKGSDILRFVPPSTTRQVRYMVDLGEDLQDDADNRRVLSEAYLEVLCPDVNGIPQTALTFKFLVQTFSYGSNDCSDFEPNFNRIAVTVNGSVKCIDGGQYSVGTIEENNAALWQGYESLKGKWLRSTACNRFNTPDIDTNCGEAPGVPELGAFWLDNDGDLVFEHYYGTHCSYGLYTICKVLDLEYENEYCEVALCNDGSFGLDPVSKALIYTPADPNTCGNCEVQPIPCITFCDHAVPEMPTVTNVIRADARIFSDQSQLISANAFPLFDFSTVWSEKNPGSVAYNNKNSFESGYRGKWRPVDEYIYRAPAKAGSGLFSNSASTERNYNDAGVFDLVLFSWEWPALNDPTKWLNSTTVTRYSQNGEPVEEEDIFGISSAARFGYAQQVPILVAKNAEYDAVSFLSFEDGTGLLEVGEGPVVEGNAHSGRFSFSVPSNDWSDRILYYYPLGPVQLQEKILIRFWIKQTYSASPVQDEGECPINLRFDKNGTSLVEISYPDIKFVAKTGAWSLYEAIMDAGTITLSGPDNYDLRVKTAIPGLSAWLDDFRIQPYRSEMVCYAYDSDNLRQIALFDDQHFGVFYQYNAEGKLIRQLRETERGIRTVQETQYHTPLVTRNQSFGNIIGRFPDQHSGAMGQLNAADGSSGSFLPFSNDESSQFDLMSVELGLDRRNLKVLGVDAGQLGEKVNELTKLLDHPSLKGVNLTASEKLTLLEELTRIDSDLEDLAQLDAEGEMDERARASLHSSVQEATRRRSEIIDRLGLNESEAASLIDEVRELKPDIESRGSGRSENEGE